MEVLPRGREEDLLLVVDGLVRRRPAAVAHSPSAMPRQGSGRHRTAQDSPPHGLIIADNNEELLTLPHFSSQCSPLIGFLTADGCVVKLIQSCCPSP